MKFKTLAALFASCAFAGMSYGVSWTAGTTYPPYIAFLDGSPNSYTGSLDLATDGFNPATMDVQSATITFWFADDDRYDASEKVDITVNGVLVADNMEVDGLHPESSFASYAFVLNAAQINLLQDGVVDFTVTRANSGDTYFKKVSITANGVTNSVPDASATSALLGLGVLGLVALRKRLGAAQ